MVWALQAAGKVFTVFEERRIKGSLTGVMYELDTLYDWLLSPTSPFDPLAINDFLIKCPVCDEELIEYLQDIKAVIREINYSLAKNETNRARQIADKERERIKEIVENVKKALNGKFG